MASPVGSQESFCLQKESYAGIQKMERNQQAGEGRGITQGFGHCALRAVGKPPTEDYFNLEVRDRLDPLD